MLHYLLVFIGSLLVDVVPFVGPPAWTVMVFCQVRYHLNIWLVLIAGVTGSVIGRYVLSIYISRLSERVVTRQKNEDLEFIGQRLAANNWKVQLFVLLYTLMPLPSTPLFTAAGMAKIKVSRIIPAFTVGKFISDMIMVLAGNSVANNAVSLAEGFIGWKSILGSIGGLLVVCIFLFIDWRQLLQEKKFRLSFNIWKISGK